MNSMNNATVKEFKKCITDILMKKYQLNELQARKAIRDSYFDESLKMSRQNTLHTDPEQWADDIYEYIYEEPELMEM